MAIIASFDAVTKTGHIHVPRNVGSIFFVVIHVRVYVQIVDHQPLAPINHAQINVVRNFSFVDITATRNVTLALHALPANSPVRKVVHMDIAKTCAVNPVTHVSNYTKSNVVIKLSRLYCVHYHLRSFHVPNHAIKVSRTTLILALILIYL